MIIEGIYLGVREYSCCVYLNVFMEIFILKLYFYDNVEKNWVCVVSDKVFVKLSIVLIINLRNLYCVLLKYF